MKFKFEILHDSGSDAVTSIVVGVVPFWSKRGKSSTSQYRHAMIQSLDGLAKQIYICSFDMEEALRNPMTVNKVSARLLQSLISLQDSLAVLPAHSSTSLDNPQAVTQEDHSTLKQAPIIFIAHSIGSWVVKCTLAQNEDSSVIFETQGAIFLDVPKGEEMTADYLRSLQSAHLIKSNSDSQISRSTQEQFHKIDAHFQSTQKSPFIRDQKHRGADSPAFLILYHQIWIQVSKIGSDVSSYDEDRPRRESLGNRLRALKHPGPQIDVSQKVKRMKDQLTESIVFLLEDGGPVQDSTQCSSLETPKTQTIKSASIENFSGFPGKQATLVSHSRRPLPHPSSRPTSPLQHQYQGEASSEVIQLGIQRRFSNNSDASSTSNWSQPGGDALRRRLKQGSSDGTERLRNTMALASTYFQRAEFSNAKTGFQQAISMCKKEDNTPLQQYLAPIEEQLAAIMLYQGFYKEATDEFQRLLGTKGIGTQAYKFNARDMDLLRWKAVALLYQGHYRQALEILDKLHTQVAHLQLPPEDHGTLLVQLERDISLAYANLGFYTLAKKHLDTARTAAIEYLGEPGDTIADHKAAQKQTRKLEVKQDVLQLVHCVNLSIWGYYDEALDICQSTLKGLEARWGPKHLKTLECASLKAILLAYNGRISEAEEICVRASSSLRKHFGIRHPLALEATAHLVYILKSQYRLSEATDTAKSLHLASLRSLEKQHPLTTTANLLLAEVNLASGDYCQAISVLGALFETPRDGYGNDYIRRLRFQADYARALYHLGLFREAGDQVAIGLDQHRQFLAMGVSSSYSAPTADRLFRPDNASLEDLVEEAMQRLSDDDSDPGSLRPHPLHLFNLETFAMIEKEKDEADWGLFNGILREIWRYRARVLGANHTHTLMSRFELAAALHDHGTDADLEQAVEHFHQVLIQRSLTLDDTHPDLIVVRRELLKTNCELGQWQDTEDLPAAMDTGDQSHEHLSVQPQPTSTKAEMSPLDDNHWCQVEQVSRNLLSMHEIRLGRQHPETLKSHLWLFTVQLSMCEPIVWKGTLKELSSRLRHRTTLGQRILDSIRVRQRISSLLSSSEYYLEALEVLRDMLFDLDHHSPAVKMDEQLETSLRDVLIRLRVTIDQFCYDTRRKALTKERRHMETLHQQIEANMKAQHRDNTIEETIALSSELVNIRSLLFGKEHEQTLKARETLAVCKWESGKPEARQEAVQLVDELMTSMRDTEQKERLRNLRTAWQGSLDFNQGEGIRQSEGIQQSENI